MISIIKRSKNLALFLGCAMAVLSSCNKDLEQFAEAPAVPSGLSLGETLAASATDSLFYKIVLKSGLTATLNNKANAYTFFVPDNDAVIASFGGSLASANFVISNLPAASAAGIVSYNLIPQIFASTAFPATFPNVQIPTGIILDPTNPLVRMTTFLSKRGTQYYVNNVPIGIVDVATANGIIHKPLAIVAPPTRVLKDAMNRVANLTYFKAAIARADSGQTGLRRFDSLLNYAVTNMTVLAPNDVAFQTLIFGLAYQGYLSTRPTPYTGTDSATALATANGAVAAGPVFLSTNNITTAQVRGIMAYHFLASNAVTASNPTGAYQPNIRVFSVNFSSTASFVKTLVNSSVAVHPGILVNAIFTGPVVSTLTFSSYGSFPPGGAPFSYTANAVSKDSHAVNGVFYIIDKVLLPQ